MALGAFYGSLAASASVFIAILSAFLVNNLVSIRQDQRRLERRQTQINTELKPLESLRDTYTEEVEAIEEKWNQDRRAAIHTSFDGFIRRYYNIFNYIPIPEYLTFSDIVSDYADFEYDGATGQVSEMEQEILRERRGEAMDQVTENVAYSFVKEHVDGISSDIFVDKIIELYKDEYGLDTVRKDTRRELAREYKDKATLDGVLSSLKEDRNALQNMDAPPVVPEATANSKSQQRTREESRHTQNEIEKAKVEAEITELENQQDNVTERLASLSLAHIRRTLRDSVIAIALTVILPLCMYLCYELEVFLIDGFRWVTPIVVFVLWLGGFGLVLFRLWRGINEDEDQEYNSLIEELTEEVPRLFSRR